MSLSRIFCLGAGVLCLPMLAMGADPKSAASQPATRPDADFYLQGEYSGTMSSDNGSGRPIGLQVIALGDGKFEAVEYAGGLPGNGWDGATIRKYSGERTDGKTAVLTGDDRRLVVQSTAAKVLGESGSELGRLRKSLRRSPTIGVRPPAGATVLFFGRDAREFTQGSVTADHLLIAGADTKQPFGDFTMHLEFRTPYMPGARGQARGNSGVYIQGRYEVQILDSFGLAGANNECGGLYKQREPLLNMCLPPLAWQTYDIDFTAAKFDPEDKKTGNARITVRHNGVVIHDNVEITAKTGGGAAEAPDIRPLRLQDHGNPVHFRNIWIVARQPGSNLSPGIEDCNACDTLVFDTRSRH